TEQGKAIRHIPAVLCERGDPDAVDPKRDRVALERALTRRGIAGEVRPGLVAGTYRVKRALPRNKLVSIIIPTCAAQGMIKTCIESLRRLTRYKKYEIIGIENIPPGRPQVAELAEAQRRPGRLDDRALQLGALQQSRRESGEGR